MSAPHYWSMAARRQLVCAALLAAALIDCGCGGGNGAAGGHDGGAGGSAGGSGSVGAGGRAGAGAADGGPGGAAPGAYPLQSHSGPIAIDPAGKQLFVVHPDADSVSMIDLVSRTIAHEVLLAGSAPTLDELGRYAPAVGPRALALDSTGRTLYVTGQWSGRVYAIDVASGTLARATSAAICSEPIGILVSADNAKLFVACAQDDELVELAASDLSLIAAVPCPRKPWALAWAADATTLYATHLLGPGVSAFATEPLALTTTFPLADGPAGDDQTEPHGPVRGIYDAAVRPGTSELWVAHLMLGIDTPQPALDFQSTVFPALSILDPTGAQVALLSVQANPGDGQAFGDVVGDRTPSPSRPTAAWRSSPTPTAKTCWSSIPPHASRRRSSGRCRDTCPKGSSGPRA